MLIILAFIALLGLPLAAVILFNRFYHSVAPETQYNNLDDIDRLVIKKYDAADIHKNRPYSIIIALFITLLFTYLILEYKAYSYEQVEKKADVSIVEDEIEDIQITQIEPPPPPPEKKSIQLEVVEDEEELEEPEPEPEEEEEEEEEEGFYEEEEEEEEEEVVLAPPKVWGSTEVRAAPTEGDFAFVKKLTDICLPKLQALGSYLDDVPPGVIVFKFVVLENGKITSLQKLVGVDPRVDKIVAEQFVKNAHYTPGKNQGQPVRSEMTITFPIIFE